MPPPPTNGAPLGDSSDLKVSLAYFSFPSSSFSPTLLNLFYFLAFSRYLYAPLRQFTSVALCPVYFVNTSFKNPQWFFLGGRCKPRGAMTLTGFGFRANVS